MQTNQHMSRWNFTTGRVAMLCIWSFLLGSWLTNLAVHVELNQEPPWVSVITGIVLAGGSLAMWIVWSRNAKPDR